QGEPPLGETVEARGAGYESDPLAREAVEKHAMNLAKKLLIKEGYSNISDTHQSHSYDYCCRFGSTVTYIEVKGTRTTGQEVILTRNEVKHAQKEKSALVIVHSIKYVGGRAQGGQVHLM